MDNLIYHYNLNIDYSNVYIMQRNGEGFVRISWYNNDDNAFISDLSVNKHSRNKGLGNILLKESEKIMKIYNKKFSQLNVLKNSWMKKWYKRKGYTVRQYNDNYCLMIKCL